MATLRKRLSILIHQVVRTSSFVCKTHLLVRKVYCRKGHPSLSFNKGKSPALPPAQRHRPCPRKQKAKNLPLSFSLSLPLSVSLPGLAFFVGTLFWLVSKGQRCGGPLEIRPLRPLVQLWGLDCYKLLFSGVGYDAAATRCEEHGAFLVSVRSAEENLPPGPLSREK